MAYLASPKNDLLLCSQWIDSDRAVHLQLYEHIYVLHPALDTEEAIYEWSINMLHGIQRVPFLCGLDSANINVVGLDIRICALNIRITVMSYDWK